MRHSLHSHILYLENRLQSLRDRLTTTDLDPDEIPGLEQQIALAELALARYREAYALEISVASPDGSDGAESNGGGGAGEDSTSEKRKGGGARARKMAQFLPGFAVFSPGRGCDLAVAGLRTKRAFRA